MLAVSIIIKSPQEVEIMRQAGRILAMALAAVVENVRAGVTTAELDVVAEKEIRGHKAVP